MKLADVGDSALSFFLALAWISMPIPIPISIATLICSCGALALCLLGDKEGYLYVDLGSVLDGELDRERDPGFM